MSEATDASKPKDEENKEVVVAVPHPPQLAVVDKKHPLEHSWSFWYDQRGGGKSAPPGSQGRRGKGEKKQFENNLRFVGDFATVEDFWSYFNNMRKPSGLESNSNYHVFKNGIKPMWEDPQNNKGGKWILLLKGSQKDKLNEYWETIVLSIIGEMLEPEENGDEICGAVMSKRKTGDRIAVWNRRNNQPHLIMAMGKAIQNALSTPNNKVKLTYQVHEDSLKTGASYTNPAKVAQVHMSEVEEWSEETMAAIQKKLSQPMIFVEGRRRFRNEPLPETEAEDEPASPMDELNLNFLDALCEDDLARMELFYELGADVNHQNPGAMESPLHFAVCRNDITSAKWLIEHGANVNARACREMTPMHWAVRLGQLEMVKLLLDSGAEPHPQNERGVVPYWYTNKEQSDCVVPKETREAIQKLLVDPPVTQILFNQPIVFGADDVKKIEKEKREREQREKEKTRVPKNAAEKAGRVGPY